MNEKLEQMIAESRRIVFFGGAGVSTESGIPDFRSVDGLYRMQYDEPPEIILSHSYFMRQPERFFRFYRDKMLCLTARPNAAHVRLAELEREGRLAAVVTQNIDGLHQSAGSREVLELHGSVHRNFCMACGRQYDAAFVQSSTGIPRCACGGIVKPDVVLYEEPLNGEVLEAAVTQLRRADLLIVGGTSLAVWPAASLVDYFTGEHIVLINREPTRLSGRASLVITADIGETLRQF